ncbi:MAG: prepilin-type cleavage/methylation domain-containing protein [Burkholderiaceae bacterium]|nr:prepilin-type cleavage/methylation domain-containing protein [Rhodoferax sp.]MCP5273034.1 prepilin-type cleavage/methylation domain-containing protein [Burkholderiaceae bacterium]
MVVALVAVLASLAANAWGGYQDRIRTKQAVDDITGLSALLDQTYNDTGELPANLAAIGRGGMADPWGNAYVYLNLTTRRGNGGARKDHSLVPLNSDYDLYSKGPDGRSSPPLTANASKDDILRANNGRFIGPASSY